MRHYNTINNQWQFIKDAADSPAALSWQGAEIVDLPHSVCLMPLNYFSEALYQTQSAYRKTLYIAEDARDQRLVLTLYGAAHQASIYLNKQWLKTHAGGYSAFDVELTAAVKPGQDNEIIVLLDSRESLNIPPFGGVVDYLTYGGLYREVTLSYLPSTYIADVYVATASLDRQTAQLVISSSLDGELTDGAYSLRHQLLDNGQLIASFSDDCPARESKLEGQVSHVQPWHIEQPKLYILRSQLYRNDQLIDQKECCFGIRTVHFRADGFYLNGKKLLLRGINRHQSYPYVGYAMPARPQRQDADICKYELGLNAVRTSHYPQSHHFIERCDEIGLLVFTEIPGWQHIGDDEWKEIALQHVQEMVSQYRNHPSIMLWGVRINESQDDNPFYEQTNRLARSLDPYRQTGGVRFIKQSHLLEDVYTFNDFSHSGANDAILAKKKVSPDMNKAYLISEYNGHMFPTKSYDSIVQRTDQAIRHANVLNAVARAKDIAGSFAWCMFDYHTHRDFGSGDRICHHGVMDVFRNPKLAAAVYKSQQDNQPFIEVASNMTLGDYPAGLIGDVYVFSNAEYIDLYKNERFIKRFSPAKKFQAMHHPPFYIDDLIGEQLIENESYDHATSRQLVSLLMQMARHGDKLPIREQINALRLKSRYGITSDTLYHLFNRYIANWGDRAISYRFDAIVADQVVATKHLSPSDNICLQCQLDSHHLVIADTYDVASLRIKAVDQNDTVLSYFHAPIQIEVTGPLQVIGPPILSLQGGMAGSYLKTTNHVGRATLRISLLNRPSINQQLSLTIVDNKEKIALAL